MVWKIMWFGVVNNGVTQDNNGEDGKGGSTISAGSMQGHLPVGMDVNWSLGDGMGCGVYFWSDVIGPYKKRD